VKLWTKVCAGVFFPTQHCITKPRAFSSYSVVSELSLSDLNLRNSSSGSRLIFPVKGGNWSDLARRTRKSSKLWWQLVSRLLGWLDEVLGTVRRDTDCRRSLRTRQRRRPTTAASSGVLGCSGASDAASDTVPDTIGSAHEHLTHDQHSAQ